jgi:DnaK suppressor protein
VDDARARELLVAERERIEKLIARREPLGDDADHVDQFDEADTATDLWQEEFDEGLEEDLDDQLAAVERAEQRLAEGTYGLSIESGEPIPDERLEVFPTAELTTEEAARRR